MRVKQEVLSRKKTMLTQLRQARLPFWNLWRDLANYILPTRYTSLLSPQERVNAARQNYILDSSGTRAARTLAAGMMNGITSPARPWFKLRLADFEDDLEHPARVWLDEVERRILQVMAESNFYQAIGVMYLDLSVFATASCLIYEDPDKVIHCHNSALGEYYLMIDRNKRVCGICRELDYTVYQLVQEFGEENVSPTIREKYKKGDSSLLETIRVIHLIEPNDQGRPESLPSQFAYRELFWQEAGTEELPNGFVNILRLRGYFDFPGICPRWEIAGNDAYGTGPGMDALGDIIQLQHETKKKAQGIDKMISPPMLADMSLQHKPTAMLPNSVTYVPRLSNDQGMKPAYQVNPPLNEMMLDMQDIRQRIRDTFFNFLFNDISNLETVRSATEIAARKEEKLVLLGPVLERFENECLDPAIRRIFGIMVRNKLLPEAPPELQGKNLTIQYVSILAAAQSAVGTVPTERFLQIVGNMVPVFPEARFIPNVVDLLLDYAKDTGVKAKNLHTRDEIMSQISAENEATRQQGQADQATQAVDAAKLLSETDAGGGANALQLALGR